MSEVEPTVSSLWTSMANWFTPTVLFCLLNLMIGTIFFASNFKSHPKPQLGEDNSPQLVRAPSFLDRVRSFNFYNSEPDPFQPESEQTGPPDENPSSHDSDNHVTRSKSDTSGEAPARVQAKMKKSASEKIVAASRVGEDVEEVDRRRPATVRERKGKMGETASFGVDEAVDKKADEFINRFKQQLKLQRLDSLLRYKEMFSRGSGR